MSFVSQLSDQQHISPWCRFCCDSSWWVLLIQHKLSLQWRPTYQRNQQPQKSVLGLRVRVRITSQSGWRGLWGETTWPEFICLAIIIWRLYLLDRFLSGQRRRWENIFPIHDFPLFLLTTRIDSFIPCSVLILASDWLTTVKYGAVSHVWRHQREI